MTSAPSISSVSLGLYFISSKVIGICGVSVKDAEPSKFYEFNAANMICKQNGYAFYHDGITLSRMQLSTGTVIKLADWDPLVMYTGSGIVLGDTLYFKSFMGFEYEEYSEKWSLWKVPVTGGKMEQTDSVWFESQPNGGIAVTL
jgi:hypothetical protein